MPRRARATPPGLLRPEEFFREMREIWIGEKPQQSQPGRILQTGACWPAGPARAPVGRPRTGMTWRLESSTLGLQLPQPVLLPASPAFRPNMTATIPALADEWRR